MKLTLIGLPGSGKSTLAKRLAGLGLHYVSSGDLARAHGFAGSKAEGSGQLDPDEGKIVRLVREAVRGKKSYVLDGFPRQSGQASKVPIDYILFLDVIPKVAVDRLLMRGRLDDKLPIIRNRIEAYREFTIPLLSRYLDDVPEKVIRVDASEPEDVVFIETMVELIKHET